MPSCWVPGGGLITFSPAPLLPPPGPPPQPTAPGRAPFRVHAFLFDLFRVLDKARKMLGGACRRKGSRETEEHDLLALEKIIRLDRLWRPALHLHEHRRRDLVTYLDRHKAISFALCCRLVTQSIRP